MDSWHRLSAESSALLGSTGIPRRVLSRLLSTTGIGIGCSVLDVGCGRGELVAYLDSLGIRTVGIDESPQHVMAARRTVPTCEIHHASIGDPLPSNETQFDLVLIRNAAAYRAAMLSRPTLIATGRLLARVRPGGCLAFLTRLGADNGRAGHRPACYAMHIRSFSETHALHVIPDGFAPVRKLRSLITGGPSSGYAMAVLRTSRPPMSEADFTRAVNVASAIDHAPCCQWAAQIAETSRRRLRAA